MLQSLPKNTRSGVLTLLLFVWATVPAHAAAYLDGAALHRAGQAENLCALTFDDGPGKHTERLLDLLRDFNVRATFFVIGERAQRNPGIIQRMVAEGHEVANHTYSHKSLRHLSEADQLHQIEQVQKTLTDIGVVSAFLRPPYGRYDAVTLRILAKLNLKVALWSADSHDWQRRASIENIKSVYGTPARNGVILFHDTHQPTVDAMADILTGLVAGQCRFVTMSEFYAAAEVHAAQKGTVPPHGTVAPPQPLTPESSLQMTSPTVEPVAQQPVSRQSSEAMHPGQAHSAQTTSAHTAPVKTTPAQAAPPSTEPTADWSVDGVWNSVRAWLVGDAAAFSTP